MENYSGPTTTATSISEGRMKVDSGSIRKRLLKRKNRSIKNGVDSKKSC